jgi:hypothetical protein
MRMIIGGNVPLGIQDMARSDIATTWAIAWPMLVPGKNESSVRATCWIFRVSITSMPSTYWK